MRIRTKNILLGGGAYILIIIPDQSITFPLVKVNVDVYWKKTKKEKYKLKLNLEQASLNLFFPSQSQLFSLINNWRVNQNVRTRFLVQ